MRQTRTIYTRHVSPRRSPCGQRSIRHMSCKPQVPCAHCDAPSWARLLEPSRLQTFLIQASQYALTIISFSYSENSSIDSPEATHPFLSANFLADARASLRDEILTPLPLETSTNVAANSSTLTSLRLRRPTVQPVTICIASAMHHSTSKVTRFSRFEESSSIPNSRSPAKANLAPMACSPHSGRENSLHYLEVF